MRLIEDNLNSFYLENDGKENYNFCFGKQEGNGYKIKDSFILDKAIKLFNFKKDLIYQGFDSNNQVVFKTEDGVINSIDNTKININVPKGCSVKITNKEGIFETIRV